MDRRVGICLAAALLTLAAGTAGAQCKITKLMELPVTLSGSRAFVTTQVNGTDVSMLIDTGSFFNAMPRDSTRLLKLETVPAPNNMIVQGLGGVSFADVARAEEFKVGRQTFHRVDFLVVGPDGGSSRPSGALGQNFLRLADDEFDVLNGVVRLMRTQGCDGANLAYWEGKGEPGVMDIQPTDREYPHIIATANFNGKSIHFVLDSGASTSLLSLHAAAAVGITPSTPGAISGGFMYGAGPKPVPSWIVPVESLTIDNEEIKHTRVRIAELDLLPGGADMLLGADFFLSHRLFIAYQQRKVFFTYNGGPVFDLSVHGPAAGTAEAAPLPPNSGPAPGSGPASPAATAAAEAPAAPPTAAAETPAAPAAATPASPDASPVPPAAAATDAGSDAPHDAAGFKRRARAFAIRGQLDLAIADYERAMQLDPGDHETPCLAAELYLRSGRPQQARAHLDRVLSQKPDLVPALLLRGRLKLGQHDDAGARVDFDGAIAHEPGNSTVALQVASIYTGLERYADALALLDQWIAAHPDHEAIAGALNDRCYTRALLGQQLDAALADCDAAVKRRPGAASILDSRGLVHLRRGEWQAALKDYDAALSQASNLAPALYGRGLARLRAGRAKEGQADLAAATAIAPRIAERFQRMGLTP